MGERFYVYAITDADIRLPDAISGFGGPLFVTHYAELGAVVSVLRTETGTADIPAPTPENLLRHEAVVEAIHAGGRGLPVRFGTALATNEAVTDALARNYTALRRDLQRIGDKVEVGVNVLWGATEGDADPAEDEASAGGHSDESAGSAERPGLAYLRARQAEHRQTESTRIRAQALGRDLDSELRQHALQRRRSVCPSGRLALRDIYLVEREQLEAIELAFEQVRSRHPEVRFLWSGPWPPYSFIAPPGKSDAASVEPMAQ